MIRGVGMSGSGAVSVKRSVAAVLTVAAMGLATACADDGRSGESVEDSGDSEENTGDTEARDTPVSGWEPGPSTEPVGGLSDGDLLEIVQKADAGADLEIPDGVDWVSLVVDIGAGVEARWRVPGGMVTAARPIWAVSDDEDDVDEVNTVYFAGDNRGTGNDSDAGQGWVQPSVQLQPGQSVDLGVDDESDSDPLGVLYFDGMNLVHWGEEGSPEGQVSVLNPEEGFREVQLDQ
ncbi:hypothetical protein [Corynebacterium sputi]|uniref:hypothetical protein n=1 Tax=Corynebacterium sputi TaxID=489915 RepID=UPI00196A1CCF|nr:hypothetical protein [Corynebacterium sputi]